MKKTITVIVASLSFVFAAGATDIPGRYETFLGYQFTRFNPNLPVGLLNPRIDSVDANGGSGQFIYNFDKWFGVVFDAGAVTNSNLNPLGFLTTSLDTTVTHFVAGPRFTYHTESRFMPYAEVMFGGAHGTSSFLCDPAFIADCPVLPSGFSTRVQVSHTSFALMAGGGIDIKVSKHVAFRPAGFDYYLTRSPLNIPALGITHNDRNNWRYTAGVTFMFGAL
jgi:opacity protein-like surface antigen